MKAARQAVAISSGALLYCAATLGAIVFARAGLPRDWYTALGGRSRLPVLLGEAVVTALVVFGVAMLWAFFTLRPAKRRHRPYVAWFVAGVLLAWVAWLVYGAFSFALQPKTYTQPLQSLLLNASAAPLFGGLYTMVAVIAGAYLGGRWAVRVQMALPSSRTPREPVPEPAGETASGSASDSATPAKP